MVFEAIFLGLMVGGGVGYFIYLKHRKKERNIALKKVNEGTLKKVREPTPPQTNKDKKPDSFKSKSKNHTQLSEANRMLPKKEEESTFNKVEKADLIPPLPPINTSLIFPPSNIAATDFGNRIIVQPQRIPSLEIQQKDKIPTQPKKKKIRVSRKRKREVSDDT